MSGTFRRLRAQVGISVPPGQRPPRPHDLRHTFAVDTLTGWHADGVDVERRLPVLSTYLGHVNPANTYWYCQAVPQLMGVVADRVEASRRSTAVTALAPVLQGFFTDRLAQRRVSPHTVAAYRDTWRLLLALRPRPHRHRAGRARPRPTRRRADRRVPRPPRRRPAQQRPRPATCG